MKTYKIGDLNPSAYNPRKISKEAMEGLEASIKNFGLVENFVVNIRTGNLVSGHQRLNACKNLGINEVPVCEVDLNDAEEKALNIILNSPEIEGDYCNEKLQLLLNEIKSEITFYDDVLLQNLEVKPVEFKEDLEEKKTEDKTTCPECGFEF